MVSGVCGGVLVCRCVGGTVWVGVCGWECGWECVGGSVGGCSMRFLCQNTCLSLR